jgi:hypothetical protein
MTDFKVRHFPCILNISGLKSQNIVGETRGSLEFMDVLRDADTDARVLKNRDVSRRDTMIIARHFSAGICEQTKKESPRDD